MAPEKEKITRMILYVDLKCPCCYKKVRKLLCKFPQIRDQVFHVDKNKVTITVVCCDPERLRDKLCCKGGGAIQSIEIVKEKPPPQKQTPPPVPKLKLPSPVVDPSKPVDQPKPVDTPKPVDHPKPVDTPKPVDHPKPTQLPPPVSDCCQECHEGRDRGPCHYGYGRPVPPPPKTPIRPVAVSVCCQVCYEGWDGGPCRYGCGRLVPPPPCYYYYGYQYQPNRPCYVSRCDYFSEDYPQGCSIM